VNKVIKQQVSFEKGMVETFKQEGLGANENLTSVLYLENYNPNLEQMSLIKRPGISQDSLTNYEGLNYYRGGGTFSGTLPLLTDPAGANEIANGALMPYTAPLIQDVTKFNNLVTDFIQHFAILETSNFSSNKTQLLFSKAFVEYNLVIEALMPKLSTLGTQEIPSVMVTSFSKCLDTPASNVPVTRWYNAWKNCFDMVGRVTGNFSIAMKLNQTFPGWWALGNFRDAIRYGESMLFSTSFTSDEMNALFPTIANQKLLLDYLYPVYKWALWDIRKKRYENNQFWNGVALAGQTGTTTLENIANNRLTGWKILTPTRPKGISAGIQYRTTKHEALSVFKQVDPQSNTPSTTVANNTWFDFNLMLWSEKIEDNIAYFNRFATGAANSTTASEVRTEGMLFSRVNGVVPSVNTIEYPRHNGVVKALNTLANLLNVNTFQNAYYTTSGGGGDGMMIVPEIHGRKVEAKSYVDKLGRAIKGILTTFGSVGGRTCNALLNISFPNYVQAQLPRPYFEGDELHFVTTIKINNIEYLLLNQKVVLGSDVFGVTLVEPHRTTVNTVTGNGDTSNFVVTPNCGAGEVGGPIAAVPYFARTTVDPLNPPINQDLFNYGRAVQTAGYADLGDPRPRDINAIIGERVVLVNGKPFTHSGGTPDKTFGGQSTLLKSWNTIGFTILLSLKMMQTLIEQNASSINVYLLEANQEEDFFNKVGIFSAQEPPQVLYKPSRQVDTENADFSKFGLLKKFLIDGKGNLFSYDFTNEQSYSKFNRRATNAWRQDNGYVWAVPQNYTATTPMFTTSNEPSVSVNGLQDWTRQNYLRNTLTNDTSVSVVSNTRTGNYWSPDFYVWDYPTDTTFLALGGSGKYWEGTGSELVCNIQGITFISGCRNESFELEQATVRWGVIQNGAASYDAFYVENEIKFGALPHTALVNYRDTLWVFNREEFYRLALPNPYDISTWQSLDKQEGQGAFCSKQTAVTPYGIAYCNENGIWLSDGSKPQSLTNNPNQGIGITGLYQRVAMNVDNGLNPAQHIMSGLEQHPLVGNIPLVPVGLTFNPKNELVYDLENDELVYITEANMNYTTLQGSSTNPDAELRLVFNFAKQNWRTETYVNGRLDRTTVDVSTATSFLRSNFTTGGSNTAGFFAELSTSLNSATNGRMHVANPNIWTLRNNFVHRTNATQKLDSSVNLSMFLPQFLKPNKSLTYDVQTGTLNYNVLEDRNYMINGILTMVTGLVKCPSLYGATPPGGNSESARLPIIGKFITHILSDGNDDHILKRVLATLGVRGDSVTATPIGTGYTYSIPANATPATYKSMNYANTGLPISLAQDPCIAYEPRTKHKSLPLSATGMGNRTLFTDLIAMNFATKNSAAINPFVSTLQTPGGTNQVDAVQRYNMSESLVLDAPLNAQYRFIRFVFQSEVIQKVFGFVFESVKYNRRSQ